MVGRFLRGTVAEFETNLVEVEVAKELVKGFGTHTNDEFVGIGVVQLVVAFGEVFHDGVVFLLGEKVEFLDRHLIQHGFAGLEHDKFFVIDYLFESLARDIEQGSDFIGKGTEKPDVGDRDGEFDVSHALATDFLFGNLDTATVADDAFVADALIFSAMALPVASGAENLLAEEAVALGLVGAVVDSLRLGHFAEGAFFD